MHLLEGHLPTFSSSNSPNGFEPIIAAVKLTCDKGSKISTSKMTAMNLTTWPEIALFVITDEENKTQDSKSVTCIVSDIINWAM